MMIVSTILCDLSPTCQSNLPSRPSVIIDQDSFELRLRIVYFRLMSRQQPNAAQAI